MIISPGRGYLFVHIPKTGGTSLACALEARAKADDILIGDTPKALKRKRRLAGVQTQGRLWKHSTLADIDGLLRAEEIAALQVVTLVRNPWDRAVSYYHWLRAQGFAHPAVGLAKALSFADFLRHPHTVESLQAWPVRRYLTDCDGREHPALVLRLEQLETDVARLEALIGCRLSVPHVNRSDRVGDYAGQYDVDLAAHLGRVCAEDIARFGYRFEPA